MNHLDINVDIMKSYNKMKFDRNQKTGLNVIKKIVLQNIIFQQKKLLEKNNRLEEKKPEILEEKKPEILEEKPQILEENIQKTKITVPHSNGYNKIRKGLVVIK